MKTGNTAVLVWLMCLARVQDALPGVEVKTNPEVRKLVETAIAGGVVVGGVVVGGSLLMLEYLKALKQHQERHGIPINRTKIRWLDDDTA